MSMTEALEMMPEVAHSRLRSRPSRCLAFSYDFLRSHARFRDLDPRMPEGLVAVLRRKRKDLREQAAVD
jgi:hypothetical protein